MFEKCQLILKNCQHPREYNSFVEEFLIDIIATIAAIEDVCPIAKRKSIKDCPVLTGDANSDKNRTKLIVISTLVKEIVESDYKETNIKLSSNKDIIRETRIDTKADTIVETKAAFKVTEGKFTPLPTLMKKIKGTNRKDDGKHDIKTEIKQNEMLEINKYKNIRTVDEATVKVGQDKIPSKSINSFKYVDSDKNTKENHREDKIEISVTEQVTDINSFGFEAQDQPTETDILEEEEDISEEYFSTCQANDTSCIITRLLFIVSIVSLVLLAIFFYLDYSQGLATNYPQNRVYI